LVSQTNQQNKTPALGIKRKIVASKAPIQKHSKITKTPRLPKPQFSKSLPSNKAKDHEHLLKSNFISVSQFTNPEGLRNSAKPRAASIRPVHGAGRHSSTARHNSGGVDMMDRELGAVAGVRKFIVGIDYRTTYTSVSYHATSDREGHLRVFPDDVSVIIKWPNDSIHGINIQVPTETWYPSAPQLRQPASNQFELSDSDPDTDSDTKMECDSRIPTAGIKPSMSSKSQPLASSSNPDIDDENSAEFL